MTATESYRHVVLRQAFHAFNALWGVLAYHAVVPRGMAIAAVGGLTALFGVGDFLRLHRPSMRAEILAHPLFGRIIRPHELDRLSGGVWFGVGVFVTLVLYPREIAEAACLVLGFGDAASTVAGTRWGSVKLLGGRSLQGTLAFLAASALAVAVFRVTAYADATPTVLRWTAVAAITGALTEAVSTRIDDNLTVPVVTGAALWMVGSTP